MNFFPKDNIKPCLDSEGSIEQQSIDDSDGAPDKEIIEEEEEKQQNESSNNLLELKRQVLYPLLELHKPILEASVE